MSPAGDSGRRPTAFAVLSAALLACNAIVGIEEPVDISAIDSGLAADAPAPRPDGSPSMRDADASIDAAATDAPVIVDAVHPLDTGVRSDGGARDGSGGPITDGMGGGTITDGTGGAPRADSTDAGGVVVPPNFASGSCTFSSISGANADTSAYTSTQGVAKRKLAAAEEIIELNLTNFLRGVQRTLIVRFRGPISTGKTITLNEVDVVEYYDVKTGYGWGSAFAAARAGILRIESVNGTSFSFTLTNVRMGAHTNTVGSLGTFTLDGYGNANAP
jgi:hypothetical protein